MIVRSKETRKVPIQRLNMSRVKGGPDMYSEGWPSVWSSRDFVTVTMTSLSFETVSHSSNKSSGSRRGAGSEVSFISANNYEGIVQRFVVRSQSWALASWMKDTQNGIKIPSTS